MFKIIKKQTRSNLETSWWNPTFVSSEVSNYISENYSSNIVETNVEISDDGLTLSRSTTWANRESYEAFINDEYVINNLITPSQEYMNENNITRDPGVGEEI